MCTNANEKFNRSEKVRQMVDLLQHYGHNADVIGCMAAYDEWNKNKDALWHMLAKHPTFKDGKIRIPTKDFQPADLYKAYRMLDGVWENFVFSDEAVRAGEKVKSWNWAAIFDDVNDKECVVTESTVTCFESLGVTATKGQKFTRPLLKYLKSVGFDKYIQRRADTYKRTEMREDREVTVYDETYPSWGQWEAKFCDYCSVTETNYDLIVSIDPIDYLTMSFGNSWASCHTIDPDNLRGKQGERYLGQYRAGTISYMLDKVTMIGYWISNSVKNSETPELEDKVIRQTFHFDVDSGLLVQGRLYPRDQNNGDNSLYKHLRLAVEKAIAEMLDAPNKWLKKSGNASRYYNSMVKTASGALHYPDYCSYPNPVLAVLKSKMTVVTTEDGEEDESERTQPTITIGHPGICLKCGESAIDHNSTLFCVCCERDGYETCTHCGRSIDTDDEDYAYRDGDYYCYDCCTRCDYCDELIPPCDDQYNVENDTYCYDCLNREIDRDNIHYCEWCHEYEHDDGHVYVSDYGWVCKYGLGRLEEDEDVFYCDYCEEWHYRETENVVHNDIDDIDSYIYVCDYGVNRSSYIQCEECGEWFVADHIALCDDDCRHYCANCAEYLEMAIEETEREGE